MPESLLSGNRPTQAIAGDDSRQHLPEGSGGRQEGVVQSAAKTVAPARRGRSDPGAAW